MATIKELHDSGIRMMQKNQDHFPYTVFDGSPPFGGQVFYIPVIHIIKCSDVTNKGFNIERKTYKADTREYFRGDDNCTYQLDDDGWFEYEGEWYNYLTLKN